MATITKHLIERLSGQSSSLQLPIFVWGEDDGTGIQQPITLAQAIAEIDGSMDVPASIDVDGIDVPNDGDPRIEQTGQAWRLTVNYREPGLRALFPGSRVKFAHFARPRFFSWAPVRSVTPGDGPTNGFIVPTDSCATSDTIGRLIAPGQENLGYEIVVPASDVTGSWVRSLASMIGCVSNGSLAGGAYAAGEIQFVRAIGTMISGSKMHLDFGWSWRPNVSGEDHGGISIDYNGHDFVWEIHQRIVSDGRTHIFQAPLYVIVSAVWAETNLGAIGIEPPG